MLAANQPVQRDHGRKMSQKGMVLLVMTKDEAADWMPSCRRGLERIFVATVCGDEICRGHGIGDAIHPILGQTNLSEAQVK